MFTKKRINLILSILVMIVFTTSGCDKIGDEYTFIVGNRYEYELNNVEKVRIVSSNHDGAIYETTNFVEMRKITSLLAPIECDLSENQESAGGWSYYIDIFEDEDDEGWFRFTFGASPISFFYKDIEESKLEDRNFYIRGGDDLKGLLKSYFE